MKLFAKGLHIEGSMDPECYIFLGRYEYGRRKYYALVGLDEYKLRSKPNKLYYLTITLPLFIRACLQAFDNNCLQYGMLWYTCRLFSDLTFSSYIDIKYPESSISLECIYGEGLLQAR